MTKRLRVGVVGTGLIAQVMHLHYLAELADSYEVAAVCDIVAENARACAERYRVPAVFTDWREMLRQWARETLAVFQPVVGVRLLVCAFKAPGPPLGPMPYA